MATYTNYNGTKSADKLTYNKNGTWKAGAGNDTVYVKSSKALTLYGEAGNDVIHVSAGSNHVIDVGAGNDTVNLTAGSIKTLKLVSGTNTVNASKGTITTLTGGTGIDKVNVKGATVSTANLGNGNDVLTVTSGTVTSANLGAGNDSVTISGGTIKTLATSSGTNTINVKGGTLTTLKAGSGTDTINVSGGTLTTLTGTNYVEKLNISNGTVNSASLGGGNDVVSMTKGTLKAVDLGAGNDSLAISGGTITTLKANSGNNTLNVKGGTVTTLTGGSGNDILNVSGGTVTTANLGNGNDTLNFSGGTITNQVNMGTGNDTINISGGAKLNVAGGAGSDTYRITNLSAGKNYTIVNTGNSATEKDIMDFSAYKSTDFAFTSTANGDIVMRHTSGAVITVQGILNNTNDLKSTMTFKFSNTGAINVAKASHLTNTMPMNLAASVSGTVYNDVFAITKTNKTFHTSIKNYTANDKLDFTAFNDANYSFGFKANGDNLVVYLYKNDNGTVTKQGYVNVENYFNSDSKLNTILTKDGAYSFNVAKDGSATVAAMGSTMYVDMATVGTVETVGGASNLVLKGYGLLDLQYNTDNGTKISTKDGLHSLLLGVDTSITNVLFDDMTVSLEQLRGIADNDFVYDDGNTVVFGQTAKDAVSFEVVDGSIVINNWNGKGDSYTVDAGVSQIKLKDAMLKLGQGTTALEATAGEDVFVMGGTANKPMNVLVSGSDNLDTLDFTGYGADAQIDFAGSVSGNNLVLGVTVNGDFVGNVTLKDYYLGDSFGNEGNVGQQVKFYKDGALQTATIYASDANGGYTDLDMLREFWGEDANVLFLGMQGADEIISSNDKDIIYTGSGNDALLLEGVMPELHLGDGNNTVAMKNLELDIYSPEPKLKELKLAAGYIDVVNMTGNTLNVDGQVGAINGTDGSDAISLKNNEVAVLAGGNGNDAYTVDFASCQQVTLRNDNSTGANGSIGVEKDTLKLQGINSTDVTYALVATTFGGQETVALRIADKADSSHYVDVMYWDKNPLTNITFADKTVNMNTSGGGYEVNISEASHAAVYGAVAERNVAVSGGVIKVSGGEAATVYGGYSQDQVAVRANTVEISGGIVGDVYGGYSAQGQASTNVVSISGQAEVTGDVYGSKGAQAIATTAQGDTIKVLEQAFVGGVVYGSNGMDTITVGSSKATKVSTLGGDDNIYVTGGSGHILEGGAGVDKYNVDWSKAKDITINNTSDDSGRDVLRLDNAELDDFDIKYNADGDVLSMKSDGHYIDIQGWQEHGFGTIWFDNDVLRSGDVSSMLAEAQEASLSFVEPNISDNMTSWNMEEEHSQNNVLPVAGNTK